MTARREAYWVTQDGSEPQRCDPGLKGLTAAMSLAQFASRSGPPAQVSTTYEDGSAMELFEYADGQQTWSASGVVIPPAAGNDCGAQVIDITARLGQPREPRPRRQRRRREQARWPGIDLT